MLLNQKYRNLLIELRPLIIAAIFYLAVHAGDFVSTALCMAYIPGAEEANELLRDPETLKFLPLVALKIKILYVGFVVGPICCAIYAATKNAILASVPMWFLSWVGLGTVFQNITAIFLYGVFK